MNDLSDPKRAIMREPDSPRALAFDNSFVRSLPADPVLVNRPRQVQNACYTRVEPTPVAAPRLLGWSDDLGRQLGIERPARRRRSAGRGARAATACCRACSPTRRATAATSSATGPGSWATAAPSRWAKLIAADGTRQELQLKGAGRTPYSRTADGRAVLRSSLREFLCSEAMHWLGVPTTRALSLVAHRRAGGARHVLRRQSARPEPGAVVCRVAPSFLRFGNFQILAAQGEHDALRKLMDYVSENFFPEQKQRRRTSSRKSAAAPALLMADWMRLGFVHGVMNTDNMSILGLTIDYGPYGWLEGYDLAWTPNTTDAEGRRYCYGNQPHIAQWNLARLAEALLPLVPDKAQLDAGPGALRGAPSRDAWQRGARAEARRRRARPARTTTRW